jgi:tetrapyrrole methylase family protein/MazG family protein
MVKNLDKLLSILDRLLGPDGCPWDKKQTKETLKPYAIEEAYEVAEAIDEGNPEHLKEELGDLFFQIVFLSKIAEKEKLFTLDEVIETLSEKLIRRHPHIFGDIKVSSSDEVVRNWEKIKKEEKKERKGLFDGIPKDLPSLIKAQKMIARLKRVQKVSEKSKKKADKTKKRSKEKALKKRPSEEKFQRDLFKILVDAESADVSLELVLRNILKELEEKKAI